MKDFFVILDNITKAIDTMPKRIATMGVMFSKERFIQQNWIDTSVSAWRPRCVRRRGGQRRQNGAILVDTGRLKRSIRSSLVSKELIIISTDVPYARAHNEGLNSSVLVRSHTRHRNGKAYKVKAYSRFVRLPQRRFLGESRVLCSRLENLIISELQKAMTL